MFFRRFLFFMFLLLLSCARQGFPPGGPADKTPPAVVHTNPKMDTTAVPLDSAVELLFSEAVDRRSCEESIFITPLPGDGVHYKWHGNKLLIIFPKGLAANRTYVITVGVGCKDRRNNPMTAPWSLAFSTGAQLDQGSIKGQLFSEPAIADAQIWAYDLQETPNPNPAQQAPLYITQTDSRGRFQLRYLSLSRFRIFAVQDRDRNSRYNAQSEAIAVANQDLLLTGERPAVSDLYLRMAVADTTPPRLVRASAPDQQHVDLQFSEKMALVDSVLITGGPDTLAVLNHYIDFSNPAFLHLATAVQDANKSYTISALTGQDLTGHHLDSLRLITFKASALPDTMRPRYLTMSPRDSSRSVPWDAKIQIWFSKAMDQPRLVHHLAVTDTSASTVPGQISFAAANTLVFSPDKPWLENQQYKITLPVDSVTDRAGNRLADTLFVKKFITVDKDTLAEISGTISDDDSLASGRIFLQAQAAGGQQYSLWLDTVGEYRFANVMPGSYQLSAWRDQDQNGQYSPGEPFPFQPAERFYVYPDTISVRSRWPNEGNDFSIVKP